MKTQKSDTITLRINPALKRKLEVAKGFLQLSEVISWLIQQYVREFEKQYGLIYVSVDKKTQYDIITKMYGVALSPERFEELWDFYPKTRKDIAIYGD